MRHSNRLSMEKSPYLLQHAGNPVDWYAWGEEAFARAKAEDKPVFLSIGYSTCHWCHVMERESFEDEEVAALLNEAFVCVKVDREERPDIDNVYMAVCQAVTGSGGWPLTIIMTPDQRPFFAGTYFPKTARMGQMGLLELIPRVRDYWLERRDEALEVAGKIVKVLQEQGPQGKGEEIGEETLREAYEELEGRYDGNRGGFGRAPKFPTPHNLSLLLRIWRRYGEQRALEMVEETLVAMRRGGVYDQVGLGLHRYSTDAKWLVPHFEKMLYDQALLCLAALEAYQATGKDELAQIARDTFTYVLRDMTSPEGGFYSAEDADSEGVEGKFYVWTEEELRGALPEELAEVAVRAWGVTETGNFQDEASGEETGANILHVARELAEDERVQLELARELLHEAREKRVRPGLDDKVLADWNGLMIAALARGAAVLGQSEYLRAAEQAAEFVWRRMSGEEGKLLHRYREGEAAVPGYLDDYAFMAWGLIELYEASFEARYLRRALELTDYMIEGFWDEESGGFYFSSADHEELLVRQKEIYDGAVPSGNSVAMLNLLRLARLTGRAEYEARAAELSRVFGAEVRRSPSAHAQLLCAVDFAVGPASEVLLVGEGVGEMLEAVRARFLPNVVVLVKDGEVGELAPFAAGYEAVEGKATAYVCTGRACSAPVTEVEGLVGLLEGR